MRGRGLKCCGVVARCKNRTVALFARAWIEIEAAPTAITAPMVALFARAWIEISVSVPPIRVASVALFARAWIEIKQGLFDAYIDKVALFARAWIEILMLVSQADLQSCRPLCEGVD